MRELRLDIGIEEPQQPGNDVRSKLSRMKFLVG